MRPPSSRYVEQVVPAHNELREVNPLPVVSVPTTINFKRLDTPKCVFNIILSEIDSLWKFLATTQI